MTTRPPGARAPGGSSRPAGPRRRLGPGWVPRQHGAWPMLLTPVLVGAWPRPAWVHVLLVAVAVVAYLALHAVGLWLRSGRRPRYAPPAATWSANAVVLLAVLVLIEPRLLAWAPFYGVGVAASLVASSRREDRSWWNDILLVVLACGATLVSAGLRPVADGVAVLMLAPSPAAWPPPGLTDAGAVVSALVLLAYFLGTVVHVKAMIRERDDPRVYLGSILYHGVLVALAINAVLVRPGGALIPFGADGPGAAAAAWLLVGTAGLLLVRAVLLPSRWPGLSPRAIGLVEIGATLLVAVTAIAVR